MPKTRRNYTLTPTSNEAADPVVFSPALKEFSDEEIALELLQRTTGLESNAHGAATPSRFVRMLRELTTPQDFEFTTFEAESDEMIIIKHIPFVSVCNHHVVPFIGHADIGYVPYNIIAGLSKFARAVQYFARGLQVQERLTADVADFLEKKLSPRGVAVVINAEHMCMTIRGVQTPGTLTTTSAMRGVFADHDRTAKQEFLTMINGH